MSAEVKTYKWTGGVFELKTTVINQHNSNTSWSMNYSDNKAKWTDGD